MDLFHSKSAAETTSFAESFAPSLRRNEVVSLIGELGSGKTQFVKGVCHYFRVPDPVSSPTFVMLHRYVGRDSGDQEMLIYHFDLYKTRAAREVLELGYEEFFRGNGVCLIEWGDKLHELAPPDRTEVKFSLGPSENERTINVGRLSGGRAKESLDSSTISKVRNELPRY